MAVASVCFELALHPEVFLEGLHNLVNTNAFCSSVSFLKLHTTKVILLSFANHSDHM